MDFLSVECLEKLGLEQNPFIDHARDPFLFKDAQHEMSVNVLMDYLLNQNSTLVLLGEIGIGKTTHLRMLLRQGYEQLNFCTLRAKPKTTFSNIEDKIKERWRIPNQSKDTDGSFETTKSEVFATDEHVKEYIADNKRPVLIIDDAHRLENSVLDQLLRLKHHVGLQSDNTMGLVLAAEPNIQTKLAELEQTNPAATQVFQINSRAFDTTQCENYLNYRLEKAGATSQDIFSTEKIAEIVKHSNGLPKHINKLAREELLRLCERDISIKSTPKNFQSNPSMRLGLILAGLIGLVVVLASLFNGSKDTEDKIDLELSKPKLEQNKPQLTKPSSKQDSTITPKKELMPSKAKAIAKPYVAPLVLGPLQTEKPKTSNAHSNNQKAEEKLKTLAQNSKPSKSNMPTSDNNEKITVFASDWLLQQDPASYTIQLAASPDEKNLLAFITKNKLTNNTAYYKKSSTDKNWYVVVHGIYPSRSTALEAIEQLSDALKKNSPYPIQIKTIQKIIKP